MNTTNFTEEIGKGYQVTQNLAKLSGVDTSENGIAKTNTEVISASKNESEDGVLLEISEEGKQKMAEAQKRREAERLKEWAAKMKEDNENAAEHADDSAKIMTIFRRIANGDIVPSKDEKKLMEYSMEMYQAAKNLACLKQSEEKKKYKSVDEEVEEDSGAISQEEAIRALADSDSSESGNFSN